MTPKQIAINKIKERIRYSKDASDLDYALRSAVKLSRRHKDDSQIADLIQTIKSLQELLKDDYVSNIH